MSGEGGSERTGKCGGRWRELMMCGFKGRSKLVLNIFKNGEEKVTPYVAS